MPTLSRNLRSALPAALAAFSLALGAHSASAQSGTTIQTPHSLTLSKVQETPYNFTGRIYNLDLGGFGSGTLIRRHTVLTAGHVLYNSTLGFTTNSTFTRALYGNYSLSTGQVAKVATLSGYQAAVDNNSTGTGTGTGDGEDTLAAFALDQGYVLIPTAPVDGLWGNFVSQPSLLADPKNQFFVLGYPGETFDGRTMAYVVPSSEYIPLGTSTTAAVSTTASYTNESYAVEGGMSGGPIYVVIDNDPNQRYVAADTVGGTTDSSSEFNTSFVRAIDDTSRKFLSAAEYTSGLILKAKVRGPKTVQRGNTYTYTVIPKFTVPGAVGGGVTDRYPELKLKSTVAAIPGQTGVKIKKTSNSTFDVTFPSNSTTLRSGATVTLQAYYTKTTVVPGKSSLTIKIQ